MQFENKSNPIIISVPVHQPSSSSTSVSRIRSIRNNLLMLTIICFILSTIFLTYKSNQLMLHSSKMDTLEIIRLVDKISSVIIYGIGIYAAQRYSVVALIIFAWFSVIKIAVIDCLLASIDLTWFYLKNEARSMIYLILIFIGFTCLFYIVFWIYIIRMAFRLARLVNENQYSSLQQA